MSDHDALSCVYTDWPCFFPKVGKVQGSTCTIAQPRAPVVHEVTAVLQVDEATDGGLLPHGGAESDGLQPAAGGALPLPRLCLLAPSH